MNRIPPRLYLRDVPLPHLMQHLQSIAMFPRHPQLLLSIRHALSKRNFLPRLQEELLMWLRHGFGAKTSASFGPQASVAAAE